MREPIKVTVTAEMMYRDTWEVELFRVLHRLERIMEDLELQVHPYVHVEFDPQQLLVYIRPKHFNVYGAYVDATPKAVRDRFLYQRNHYYYPSEFGGE